MELEVRKTKVNLMFLTSEFQYTYLLTSQLESQRRFFEEKLQFVEDSTHERLEELERSNQLLKERAQQLQATLDAISKEKQQQEKRSSTKMTRIQNNFDEERLMNEQLRQNQNYFQTEIQKTKEEYENTVKSKNQVRIHSYFHERKHIFLLGNRGTQRSIAGFDVLH